MGGKQKGYSVNFKDYKLLEEIGYGASATVYRAMYIPFNEVVAVKCLDLDRCNSNLDDIRKEAQIMRLVDHPNLINAHCSFVVDHNLWVVMPFMSEGSCLNIMETAYPDGFEESFIGPILKETLKALEYLHQQGHIHRDVKAGNILLHSTGEVKLADFGVSACMFDRGDRQGSRNTFVGTPCWMAPEVLQPGKGYDFNADIWSFGITALELAHGHAPFSKYPPMKVLLMTLQNAPPGLDYDRDKKFSKSFKEMVAMCLVKDQTKRPTCKKLLKHSFFKNTKPPELSIKKLFTGMPPLWKRVKSLQIKDAAQLALKGVPSSEQYALSQSEYQRGISAWNFDVEDLKLRASLLQEEDEIQEIEEEDNKVNTKAKDSSSLEAVFGKSISKSGFGSGQIKGNVLRAAEGRQTKKVEILETDLIDSENQGKLGRRNDESKTDLPLSGLDKDSLTAKTTTRTGRTRLTHSGPVASGQVVGQLVSSSSLDSRFHIENFLPVERPPRVHKPQSSSGPLGLPRRASANSLSAPVKSSGGYGEPLDDKAKASMVQIKGRFSIMSESLDLAKPLGRSQPPMDIGNSNIPSSVLMPGLQNLFQQTSIQQDLIVNLLNSLQSAEAPDAFLNGELPPVDHGLQTNGNADEAITERERALLQKISVLEARMVSLTDELKAEKLKYMQLQEQMNTGSRLEVEGHRRSRDC